MKLSSLTFLAMNKLKLVCNKFAGLFHAWLSHSRGPEVDTVNPLKGVGARYRNPTQGGLDTRYRKPTQGGRN